MFSIPPACWHNIAEFETDEAGALRLSRVPLHLLPAVSEKMRARAFCGAGAELRFRLAAGEARFAWRRMPDANPVFDFPNAALLGVFYGDFQAKWLALGEEVAELRITPPEVSDLMRIHRRRFNPELVRVILPVCPEIRLVEMTGEIEAPLPEDAPALSYLAYGSSITHGAFTPLGAGTYPGVVGRILGADVRNLGFGGSARLEPEVADWIASRSDWNIASLEMGINILGCSVDEFRQRVRRFLEPFAADPRERPVFCLDLLSHRNEMDGSDQAKTRDFRAIVAEEAANLNKTWIRHISFPPALSKLCDLCSDLLHPAAHAFEEIGRYVAGEIMRDPGAAKMVGE